MSFVSETAQVEPNSGRVKAPDERPTLVASGSVIMVGCVSSRWDF